MKEHRQLHLLQELYSYYKLHMGFMGDILYIIHGSLVTLRITPTMVSPGHITPTMTAQDHLYMPCLVPSIPIRP